MYQRIQQYLSDLFKNLNATNTSFYILFYDDYTSRILNIFTIKQLRDYNIVDIKHINQLDPSDHIVDLTAIFYLSHTNVHFFVNHLNRYSKSVLFIHYTLNNIESFADQLSRGPTDNILLVFDSYTHYIAFDQFGISAPPIKQNCMQLLPNTLLLDKQLLTASVHTLTSLYMTMSTVPLIYSTNDPNCQFVASECNDLFMQWNQEYQHQKSIKSNNYYDQFQLFSGYGGIRPILLIVNRSMDVLPFLMHSWSYNVLIHDLFKLNQNQILLKQSLTSPSSNLPNTIDIDPLDIIWQNHANEPFPLVAEQIDKQLQHYKQKAQEVMAFAGVSNMNEVDMEQLTSTAQIKTVLTQLPELTQTKHILDNHMHIATSLLSKMQEIQLDKVFESEENLMKMGIQEVLQMLQNKETRSSDRIRLALLWYLMKKTNYEELQKGLTELGGTGLGCLEYLQNSQQQQQIKAVSGGSQSTDILGKFGSFGNKISENLNTAAFNTIITSVKNLMPFDTTSAVVKLTEQVINTLQGGQVPEELQEFDPLTGDNNVPFGGYVFPTGLPQVINNVLI